MNKMKQTEFQYLLSLNISSSQNLLLWLDENRLDDFDFEEAHLLVKNYLNEMRSFQDDDAHKTDDQRLYDLVSETLKGDDWLR